MDTKETNVPPTEVTSQKPKNSFRELLSYAVIAIVIVIPVRMFVAQPFLVNGASMDTTFKDGEYLIVDELSYHFREPARLDVVVFKYPIDPKKYFIKRIIGLPGETVQVQGNKVIVINKENPKGMKLSEPYIHSDSYYDVKRTLGPDEYFVMGDNRGVSSDSRIWGALPRKNITGVPFVRLLPLSRINLHPGEMSEFATGTSATINSVK
jgi:signal peptidase I